MLKMFAIIALCLISVICSTEAQIPQCGENQVYTECGSACADYCYKDDLEACTLQCVAGCVCAPGYVRSTIDSDACVLERACRTVPRCGQDKTYYLCASPCQQYCGGPVVENCPRRCAQGCFCKPGYIKRSEFSNDCIPISECQ